jgi:hypothetical protein
MRLSVISCAVLVVASQWFAAGQDREPPPPPEPGLGPQASPRTQGDDSGPADVQSAGPTLPESSRVVPNEEPEAKADNAVSPPPPVPSLASPAAIKSGATKSPAPVAARECPCDQVRIAAATESLGPPEFTDRLVAPPVPHVGGLHDRYPYYSYRRPWYSPGPVSMNVTIPW